MSDSDGNFIGPEEVAARRNPLHGSGKVKESLPPIKLPPDVLEEIVWVLDKAIYGYPNTEPGGMDRFRKLRVEHLNFFQDLLSTTREKGWI